jgi:basic membrane protein A
MQVNRKKIVIFIILFCLCVPLFFTSCERKKAPPRPIKAGFIYPGPLGSYGWSWGHDEGRKYAALKFPWLTTVFAESVPQGEAAGIIEQFIQEEKCDVIILAGPRYGDQAAKAAQKYPKTIFMLCGESKQTKNLGTYNIDFYHIYYLNGIMAGGLSKTKRIGYVASFPVPEVIRCINAFALGIKAVNAKAKISVKWLNALYAPDKAQKAAESLIQGGCDTIAYTEDTPAIIELAQGFTKKGKQIYTFSHYSPLFDYGKETVVSGQLANWGAVYEKIFTDIQDNKWSKYNRWFSAADNAAILGTRAREIINPKFTEEIKRFRILIPGTGETDLYDLVMKRYEQMAKQPPEFDPFEGPVFDNKGNLMIAQGKRPTKDELLSMMYFVDNIEGRVP